MKVSGFTFLRNAEMNGYPFIESIKSSLPIVDEFICVVGRSYDRTLELVRKIPDPKITIIESTWNENMLDRGFVYGQQKMIGQYNCSGDWAFYLEADEVIHEKDLDHIYESMDSNLLDNTVEALYFDFSTFTGPPIKLVLRDTEKRHELYVIQSAQLRLMGFSGSSSMKINVEDIRMQNTQGDRSIIMDIVEKLSE